jgi:hypothetical protein
MIDDRLLTVLIIGKLILAHNDENFLDNVTINGDLDATGSNGRLRIKTGLELNGVLRIDNGAAVVFEGTQTLATGTVEFAGDSGVLGLSEDASLTLGPDVVIHGKTGIIGQRRTTGALPVSASPSL